MDWKSKQGLKFLPTNKEILENLSEFIFETGNLSCIILNRLHARYRVKFAKY